MVLSAHHAGRVNIQLLDTRYARSAVIIQTAVVALPRAHVVPGTAARPVIAQLAPPEHIRQLLEMRVASHVMRTPKTVVAAQPEGIHQQESASLAIPPLIKTA
mgnify:CR=1 FL=1